MEIKFWYSECDRNIKEIFKLQNVFRIAKDEDRICDHDDKDGEMAGKESNKKGNNEANDGNDIVNIPLLLIMMFICKTFAPHNCSILFAPLIM